MIIYERGFLRSCVTLLWSGLLGTFWMWSNRIFVNSFPSTIASHGFGSMPRKSCKIRMDEVWSNCDM